MAVGEPTVMGLLHDVPGEFQAVVQKVSPVQYKIVVVIYHSTADWDHTRRFDISGIRTDFHARALADEEAQRLLMCAQLAGGFGDVGRG